MKLIDRLTRPAKAEQRYSLSDYMQMIGLDSSYTFNNVTYPFTQTYTQGGKTEAPAQAFTQLAVTNGIVFACLSFRMAIFAEARFQWQRLSNGRPGDLFGNTDLAILETPWPNGTTGDLLARMSLDTDIAGNFYAVRDGDTLRVLRPDWVEIALSKPAYEYDAEIVGYLYHPGGMLTKNTESFDVSQVVHWAPKPDPEARYRGMSPVTTVIREIQADSAMIVHKKAFLDHAATPNIVIKVDGATSFENFIKFKENYIDDHEGAVNAYKTLFLGGGADLEVVGKDFRELDFANTQGKGESRIASVFDVPPILVGFSEGLQSATYSNYASARRRYADGTERPRWRSASGALQAVLNVPGGARLWYDDRDIAFLREDAKDDAEIKQMQAGTMRTLVDGGYKPDTVVDAVISGDWSRLVHTDLFSVQLQPPGTVSQDMQTTSSMVDSTTGGRSLRIVRDAHGFIQGLEDADGSD